MTRDYSKALETARDVLAMICRCGHVDSEHLLPRRCKGEGCRCRGFVPAPLTVKIAPLELPGLRIR